MERGLRRPRARSRAGRPCAVPRRVPPDSKPFPERSRGAAAPFTRITLLPLAPSRARNPTSRTAVRPASMERIRRREGPVSVFWGTWRKEIIRGAALFCAVLVIGFAVHAAHSIVHEKVMSLPGALRDLRSEFSRDDGGVAVCAVWGSDTGCGPGHGDVELRGRGHNDVAVDFTVRLPRSASLGATTVVGDVHVTGARGPLVIHTMSGDVDVATAKGPVKAESMNGDVRVRVEAFGDTGGVSATTINGSVTAELPAQLDAQVEAKTVNGSITTDYPLTVNGKFMGRNVKGTLGRGGRNVHLETVNGSIRMKKVV